MSILVEIIDDHGTPDLPLTIDVTGTTIAIHPATDVAGNLASTWQQVATAVNANLAASALVTAEVILNPTGIAQAGTCNPTPTCTITDEASILQFTLVATTSLTLTFKGMKVYVPNV